jgi:hypothetical protein
MLKSTILSAAVQAAALGAPAMAEQKTEFTLAWSSHAGWMPRTLWKAQG